MSRADDALLAVATALYAGGLGDFVARRTAQAAQVDPELRGAVKALPKPAAGAWLVSLVLRRMPEEIDQVMELGATLRQAQDDLDAAQLRTLAVQRRRLLAALVRRGREAAGELGERISDAAAEQALATLQAAMADPGAERALRTGLLVRPLSSTGLGEVDLTGALALPGLVPDRPGPATRRRTVRDPLRARRQRAEKAVAAAEKEVRGLEHEERARLDQVDRLRARALQLAAEVEELTRDLAAREHARDQVEERLQDAETAHAAAGDAVGEAQEALDAARAALDRLRAEPDA